jgi:hypothetical protein
MQLTWQDNDAYEVVYLAQTGVILAVATVVEPAGLITWTTNWTAADGQSSGPDAIADGHTISIVQGEQTGAGLFVVSAECNGEFLPEIVLMLLGAGYGNASYGDQTVQTTPPQPDLETPPAWSPYGPLSAPTNITGTITTLGNAVVEFDCAWLNDANGNLFINWYCSSENGASYSGLVDFESIGGNRYRSVGGLEILPDGSLWTIRVTARTPYYETAYSNPATLWPVIVADQSLQTFKCLELGNQELTVQWTFSDSANPVAVEIESRIDGGDWKATLMTPINYQTVELYNSRYPATEQNGYLGEAAHPYRYFDGTDHWVEVRARIVGSADWITPAPVSILLRSLHYPIGGIGIINVSLERSASTIPIPTTSIYPPVNSVRTELCAAFDHDGAHVEASGFQIVTNSLDYRGPYEHLFWFASIPNAVKIGMDWMVTFRFVSFDVEGNIVLDIPMPPQSLFIPLRTDVMPAAPTNIVVSYRRVLNPFTRLQTGYEILATGAINVSGLKVSASIDGAAHVDGGFNSLSPTMTKITGITIPRDGLNHAVAIKLWVHDNLVNEDSTPLLIPAFPAVFDLEPPALPTAVTATLLRNGSDAIPDQVLVAWDSPDPVDIYVMDSLQAKRKIYSADGSESSVILENNRRFGTQDGTAQSYKFGCAAFNRSVQSDIVYAAPLTITAGAKEVAPKTPDEIAGTAEKLNQAQLVSVMATELPSVDSATISTVINGLITKIKGVVSSGGSVSLNDLGQFAAKWSADKISSTGVLVPAARSGLFIESDGFTKGTKLGRAMSDTEAALLK